MLLWTLIAFAQGTDFQLEDVALAAVRQDYGEAHADKSVDGNALTIGGKTYANGLGTHAESFVQVDLNGDAVTFKAQVGVDDEVGGGKGSIEFIVLVDGKDSWRSGVMHQGDGAKTVDVDLKGAKRLALKVTGTGDGIDYDHADWADATITMSKGAPKVIVPPIEKPYILTPKPGKEPRLTGPMIVGARPGSPFVFTVTATGQRPMSFSASGLAPGLTLDPATGRITGSVGFPSTFRASVSAKNKLGSTSRELTIVIGDRIALTPPMGWNSWNCWGGSVSQEKVLSSATAMAATLKDHGWSYVNIDDGWQGRRGGQFGAIMPNKKFPDMAALVQQIHDMGLRAGIYSTPWRGSYLGHIGGSGDNADGSYDWQKDRADEFDRYKGSPSDNFAFGTHSFIDRDVKQWAAWGIDYLKYDWNPWKVSDVKAMSDLLRTSGRDIVYSLSNSAPFDNGEDWARLAECWRTTGDIGDSWASLSGIWAQQDKWSPFAGPGHWNDPDMLVVGQVGWGPSLHPTKLTPNEQYSHISLWCLLSAPLLLGCDLAQLDEFTLNLLTNDDVLAINQDPLGKQARLTLAAGDFEVWSKRLADGGVAIGVFNKGEEKADATLDLGDPSVKGGLRVTDLWRQNEFTPKKNKVALTVPRHGVYLCKVNKLTEFSFRLGHDPKPGKGGGGGS